MSLWHYVFLFLIVWDGVVGDGVAVGDHLRIVHRDRRVSGCGGLRAAPLAPAVAVAGEGGGVPSEVGCVWWV